MMASLVYQSVATQWPRRWLVTILCVLVSAALVSGSWFIFNYKINPNYSVHDGIRIFPWADDVTGTSTSAGSGKILDHWQPVAVTRDVFVFSAYYEQTFKDRVRIVGAISYTSKAFKDLHCIMWQSDVGGHHTLTKAAVEHTGGAYGKPYSAAFFVCPLDGIPVPAFVSLADTPHLNRSLNVLPVHIQTKASPKFNLTSCVGPLFVNRTEHSLIEWIETNIILGVEFFTVYVHNISAGDLKILHYYEAIKRVEIINLTLAEVKVNTSDRPALQDIHYFGQLVALNECLYRNKGRSEFTMATDLDELIVPHHKQASTIMDMLNRIPNKGIYSIRNSYHPTDANHTAHPKVKGYDFSVKIIDNFRRSREIYPRSVLSKMIFKPNATISIDVHHPIRTVNNIREQHVDPNIGLLHHYRCCKRIPGVIEDRSTEKYLEKVLANMNITLTAIVKS